MHQDEEYKDGVPLASLGCSVCSRIFGHEKWCYSNDPQYASTSEIACAMKGVISPGDEARLLGWGARWYDKEVQLLDK